MGDYEKHHYEVVVRKFNVSVLEKLWGYRDGVELKTSIEI
ncbi:hypothetical protein GGGNBK_15610 [Sporosarcina sp. ANT_H38]